MLEHAKTEEQIRNQIERCIEDCRNCHRVCLETLSHILQTSLERAPALNINLLLDCAEVCRLTTGFIIRNSEFYPIICGDCARICTRCGTEFEQYDDIDQLMLCAETCRRAAESCSLLSISVPRKT